MPAPILTSLANVKQYLSITDDSSDSILNTLISSASNFIYKHIDIASVVPTDYTEVRDSFGHLWIRPYNWPLISVSSIKYAGTTISQETSSFPRGTGYSVQRPDAGPARLTIHNYPGPPQGKDMIELNYRAGFQLDDEEQTIPAMAEYTVTTSEVWAADIGVTLEDGTVLTKVTTTPADGEYAVSDTGVYEFNMAQAGEVVLITYAYVPSDLSQAVIELVAATFKEKDRIGIRSKSLGGQETISYFQNNITPHMSLLLQPYMRVTPR